jgi:hypothetical protein
MRQQDFYCGTCHGKSLAFNSSQNGISRSDLPAGRGNHMTGEKRQKEINEAADGEPGRAEEKRIAYMLRKEIWKWDAWEI